MGSLSSEYAVAVAARISSYQRFTQCLKFIPAVTSVLFLLSPGLEIVFGHELFTA